MRRTVNFFSNMEPFEQPLWEGGLRYMSAEHYYAAHKTEDEEVRARISHILDPFKARAMGRKLELRPFFNELRVDIMKVALGWKYQEGSMWSSILCSTYPMDLVEYNTWHDDYWGWCVCKSCAKKEDRDPKNMLGKILMRIRKGQVE